MKFSHHDLGGCGPLLLMLHGNGFHGLTLLPMSRGLTDSFRCIALDFPGHGDAADEDLPHDLAPHELAEALHCYIDRMGLNGDQGRVGAGWGPCIDAGMQPHTEYSICL